MSSAYKKIFAVIIAVLILFIKINLVKGIIYTEGTSTGNYGSCGGNHNGCIDNLGFEFTIIKVTKRDKDGLAYKPVEGTQKFRLYRYFGLGSKLRYTSPNTAKTLDIIAEGGDVFNAIMTGTKANKLGQAFYDKSNNYAILVEELFGAIYWTKKHNKGQYTFDKEDCVFYTGKNSYHCNATVDFVKEGSDSFRSSDIAKRIAKLLDTPPFGLPPFYDGYDKYNGYRNVVAALSCNLYIDTNAEAVDLCSDVDKWNYSTEGKGRKLRISQWLLQASYFNKFLKIYNAGLVYGFEITPPNGTLRLNKKNSNNKLIVGKSATFRLYKNSNCSGNYTSITVGNSGYIEKTLNPGTYSIKEYSAPSGYVKSNDCKSFNIKAGGKTTVNFINSQNCASEFNALINKSYPAERISLYNKYGFRNLLNFNITNAADACKTDTSVCGKPTSDCLSYSKNEGSFNYNNLSCFSKTGNDALGRKTFCIDNFKLTNELGRKNFGIVTSGQMVINKNKNNKIAAKGVIDRICYTYGDTYGDGFLQSSQSKLAIKGSESNYDVYFNSDKLNRTSNFSAGLLASGYKVGTNSGLTYTQYTSRVTYEYSLNPVYSKSGTGEATNNTSDRLIGYGLISKFSDKGTVGIDFELKYNGSTVTKYSPESKRCVYTAEPELIFPPDDTHDPWELNLAFRQIEKSNPFPGKKGVGRKVGSNWCDGNNCLQEGNKIIENTITRKNDSYNSTGKGPKYTITLNADTIQLIKNNTTYKNQSYDDFGKRCNTSGGNCANNFIEWLKNKKILKEG